jgi:hypothetical protein
MLRAVIAESSHLISATNSKYIFSSFPSSNDDLLCYGTLEITD